MKRISDEEIDSTYHYSEYTTWDLYIALDKVAQAQLEACEKEAQEKVKEIFKWLEAYHTDAPFHGFTVYLTEIEWQALKQKILGGLKWLRDY